MGAIGSRTASATAGWRRSGWGATRASTGRSRSRCWQTTSRRTPTTSSASAARPGLAAGLSHPNLVKVFDFDPGARPALIMEYVEGGTLDETAADGGTAVEPEALATQLLGALEHIHGAGIVHRDVKPQNVLIDEDGRAMLTDFGIAQPDDATSLTKTGLVIGTKDYMAPEVQEGERATPQSDLYSAGMVLRDHLDGDAPESLRHLVDRLTEPDPGMRPPSAKRALAYLSDGVGVGRARRGRDPADGRARARPTERTAEARSDEPGQRREYAIDIRHVLAGLALLAAVVAAIALATSGGGDSAGHRRKRFGRRRRRGAAGRGGARDRAARDRARRPHRERRPRAEAQRGSGQGRRARAGGLRDAAVRRRGEGGQGLREGAAPSSRSTPGRRRPSTSTRATPTRSTATATRCCRPAAPTRPSPCSRSASPSRTSARRSRRCSPRRGRPPASSSRHADSRAVGWRRERRRPPEALPGRDGVARSCGRAASSGAC